MEIYSMPAKGQPNPKKGTKRPHIWLTGPDPVRHKRYFIWLQQKNQAQFREEGWDLSFDRWLEIWGDKIEKRGRTRDSYCMTRKDPFKPWTEDNVQVIERRIHSQSARADQARYGSLNLKKKAKK